MTDIDFQNPMQEITTSIGSNIPYLWVTTHEEGRFIQELAELTKNSHELKLWSLTEGLSSPGKKKTSEDSRNPKKLLDIIAETEERGDIEGTIFVLRDFQDVLDFSITRKMRDIYEEMIFKKLTIIIVGSRLVHGPGGRTEGIPPSLEKQIAVIDYSLPTASDLECLVGSIICLQKKLRRSPEGLPILTEEGGIERIMYTKRDERDLVRACQGLTRIEVENSLALSLSHLKELRSDFVLKAKKQIVSRSGILEYIESDVGLSQIGGLDIAKEYISRYKDAHSDEAKAFGVEPLRGLIFTGIPGTGKSALSKAISIIWKVPLLRLDIGKVMKGIVGGSESQMRQVISVAEACAPCVLWIDEMEKAVAGTGSSGQTDGGTTSRVFSTLLHAMEEGLKGVTVIATANDITAVPSELIRRFDDVFFCDLPQEGERWDIFKIHLKKRGRAISLLSDQKKKILAKSKGFTGAEIEKVIKNAIANSFFKKEDDLSSAEILLSLENIKPLSVMMESKIKTLREQAQGRYEMASSEEKSNPSKTNRFILKG